jgi:hypothetical protein
LEKGYSEEAFWLKKLFEDEDNIKGKEILSEKSEESKF